MSLELIKQLYEDGSDVSAVAKKLGEDKKVIRKRTFYLLKQIDASDWDAKYFALYKNPLQAFQIYQTNVEKLIEKGASKTEAKYFARRYKNPFKAYRTYQANVEKLIEKGASKTEAKYFARCKNPIEAYKKHPIQKDFISHAVAQQLKEKYGEDVFEKILTELRSINEFGTKGYSRKQILAVATLATLRKMGEPITFRDITEDFSLSSRRKLSVPYNRIYGVIDGIPVQSPESFIKDGIEKLGLTETVEEKAIQLYRKNRLIFIGKKPAVIAASILDIIGNKKQEEIAEVFNVSTTAIRNTKRDLRTRYLKSSSER